MKALLLADTPYQVLNAINYALHFPGEFDLCIYHQFISSWELSDKIKKESVFCDVIDVIPYRYRKTVFSKLNSMAKLLFPRRIVLKHSKNPDLWKEKDYEIILLSCPTLFTTNVINLFPSAKIYFLEDGVGSYFLDFSKPYSKKHHFLFNKVFKKIKTEFVYEKIYLYEPGCHLLYDNRTQILPKIKAEHFGIFKRAFSFEEKRDLQAVRLIYLLQPLEQIQNADLTKEKQVISLMIKELGKDNILFRLHPRQKRLEFLHELKVDSASRMWELECFSSITNGHVLVNYGSTAAFTPKIFAGKEPTLIFLYKLYNLCPEDSFHKSFERYIFTFRELYNNPEKIKIPETIPELLEILKNSIDSGIA